jgi:hypothetical protein
MAAKTVITEQSGRVLTVRLHNPPHNFMTGEMVAELDELIRDLERDQSVGAMRAYVEELEQRGEPAWIDPEAIARWQDGTVVDLVAE